MNFMDGFSAFIWRMASIPSISGILRSINIMSGLSSLAFSMIMGFIGGVLPALRASRMNIVDALRTS